MSLSPKISPSLLYSLSGATLLGALCAPLQVSAQACADSEVAFGWSQPPRLPIEDDNSLRWPVDAGLRVTFSGDWCPSEDQVTLLDAEGGEVPSLLSVVSAETLVENGPLAPALILVKPLMSLAPRADYTLTLEPPNPRLREFERYDISFKTLRDPVGDFEAFQGLKEVTVPGCNAYIPINSENFECVTPAYLTLELTFKALPLPEATYVVTRTSALVSDEEGPRPEESDRADRLVAFVPGVTAAEAERSIKVSVPTLYAPLPRRECYKVEVWDEWGRVRAGSGEERCVELLDALMGCELPTPEPFAANAPLEGPVCDNVGLHGASGRTPIPSLEPEEPVEEEPAVEESSAEEGCEQRAGALPSMWLLMCALFMTLRRLHTRALK